MGIPPYMTPEENAKIKARIDHYRKFLEDRGYKGCYTIDPTDPLKNCYLPRENFKATNGKEYKTAEEFRKETGWFPGLEKDGICYGFYWPHYYDGYIDPWDDQVRFLEGRGYKRFNFSLSDDYLENNNLLKAHYQKTGDLPRWDKDGEKIGHVSALKKEGYKYDYPGLPEFEI